MNALIPVTAFEDDEPRVLDTDLAAALGMERPTNIRQVIHVNREELEGFGGLHSIRANPGALGGRPALAFYLNEEQALLVAMFSRTERAKEVRATLVRVFAAYRRGELVAADQRPQLPDFSNPAEAARAWAAEYEQKMLVQQRVIEVEAESAAKSELIGKFNQSVSRFSHSGWRGEAGAEVHPQGMEALRPCDGS